MAACGICNLPIGKIACDCSECLKQSHPKCNNMLDVTWHHKSTTRRSIWKCISCRPVRSKRPRRDSTGSIGSLDGEDEQYKIDEAVFMSETSNAPPTLAQIQQLLVANIESFKEKLVPVELLTEIKDTVKAVDDKLGLMNDKIESIDKRVGELEIKEEQLEKRVDSLEKKS